MSTRGTRKGRIIFYRRGGGSEDFMGGAHFFPNLKRGGHVFIQNLILNIFLKKVCNIRNQSASCATEPLLVSLSNTDLQRFCFYISHTVQYSKICLLIKYCKLFLNLQNLCPASVI